jgi:hypothetical protein
MAERDPFNPLRQSRFVLRTYRHDGDGGQKINVWYAVHDGAEYGHSSGTTFTPDRAPPIIQQILKLWNEYVGQNTDHEALMADMRSFER